jgi:hypothetical protein
MTRTELLQLLIGQARTHGFEFRKWFAANVAIPWSGTAHAVEWLARGQRSNMLLFSHGFAQHFWRSGERLTFVLPQQRFERVTSTGTRTVERRSHLRRSSREDVWRFHLCEMAASPEPLRYIRRYLLIEEVVDEAMFADGEEEESDYDNESLVRDAG